MKTESLKTSAHESSVAVETSPIRRHFMPDRICVLTFDRIGSSANVFDRATLMELDRHIDFVERVPNLRGLVLVSGKKSIFIAGADLHAVSRMDTEELRGFAVLGQRVFSRIANLSFTTVAAIHGAAMGGGAELALACDRRVMSDDSATRIGWPETSLGILPAWGGCTRLPVIVGLAKALELIVSGKSVSALAAKEMGLADAVIPIGCLIETALEQIWLGSPEKRFQGWNNYVASTFLRTVYNHRLSNQRRHYPALGQAVDVTTRSVSLPVSESLKAEQVAIEKLFSTDTSKNLIHHFLQQERAKKRSGPESCVISNVAVVGAGVMGAGIAHWLASRGVHVQLQDVRAEQLGRGMESIQKLFQDGIRRGKTNATEMRNALDRITPVQGDVPLRHMDLVIEAATERMELKCALFRSLVARSGPRTMLATNTSALSVTQIAETAGAPERIVGLHFFNPVHRMQLVEIVAGRRTDPELVRRMVSFAQQIGKLPVVVSDSPGFVVNRILMPYLMEAAHLFESGAAVGDIDAAMCDFGMPMGPMRLMDEIGLDVAADVARTLTRAFGDRLGSPAILSRMLDQGLHGCKSSAGFYLHDGRNAKPNPEPARWLADHSATRFSRAELQQRMGLVMLNEAARCWEERVAIAPEQIDFAMVAGTGFAPFRGGPLRCIDTFGAARIVECLTEMVASSAGLRFAPCVLLQELAESGAKIFSKPGGKK